jgi:hypothetical protein
MASVPAVAQDSPAPPGASSGYLPQKKWILRHWIPFDEQTLKVRLGLHGRDLEAFLYDDHHTLAMIAQQRGISPQALADELVAAWAPSTDARGLIELRDHALRIITQGHLAQHVFFHVLHGLRARKYSRRIFGLSPHSYWRLRRRGLTPLQAGRVGGVSAAHMTAGLSRILRADRDDGVARGLSWPAEADLMLKRQLRLLPCWLRRPLPPLDSSNPYGKEDQQHHHAPKPPGERTAAEERHDEMNVEHVRRHLARSCWQPPPAWSWSAHDLQSPWSQSPPYRRLGSLRIASPTSSRIARRAALGSSDGEDRPIGARMSDVARARGERPVEGDRD